MSDETWLGKWLREDNVLYMLQESFDSRGRRYEENRHWVHVGSRPEVPNAEAKAVVDMFARAPDLRAEVEQLRQDLSDARDQLEAMAMDCGRLRAELASWRRVAERLTEERDEAIDMLLKCSDALADEDPRLIAIGVLVARAAISPAPPVPVEAGEVDGHE